MNCSELIPIAIVSSWPTSATREETSRSVPSASTTLRVAQAFSLVVAVAALLGPVPLGERRTR